MSCNSGSNNIYFDSPPIMSDQRAFTSYDPMNIFNEQFKKDKNIKSNYDYRQYLIKNGDSIIRQNQKDACSACGTCEYGAPFVKQTDGGKYLYKGTTDTVKPFGHESSDLKTFYISRQELSDRHAPGGLMTQDELLKYIREK